MLVLPRSAHRFSVSTPNRRLPQAILALTLAIVVAPMARAQGAVSGSVTVEAGLAVAAGSGSTVPTTTPIAATSAQLNSPASVAVDKTGNLYIASSGNSLVEEVSAATGQIVVVAGGGSTVPTTTAIPATSAQLGNPAGVALDEAGNLYIADTNHARVEKVTAPGTSGAQIVVVAGGGGTAPTTTPIAATSASLGSPFGVAVDGAGNLYIADTYNNRVEEVSAGQIVVVAGGGGTAPTTTAIPATSASLGFTFGVAVDGAGNLYIADAVDNLVEEVSAGQIVVVAGGGGTTPTTTAISATSAEISPYGVAVDGAGDLYIADAGNNQVEEVSAPGTSGAQIVAVAGGGGSGPTTTAIPAISAQLVFPRGVAVDGAGNLYIGDTNNSLVEKVSSGTALPVTAVASTSSSQEVFVQYPPSSTISSVTVPPAADGTQEFTAGSASCTGGSCIVPVTFSPEYPGLRTGALTFRTTAGVLGTVGLSGTGAGPLGVQSPGGLSVVAGGGSTVPSTTAGAPLSAALQSPQDAVVDAAGNLYIADSDNNQVEEVSAATGQIIVLAGGGSTTPTTTAIPATSAKLINPGGVAVDGAGNLYIVDYGNNQVEEVSATTGQIVVVAGGGSTTPTTTAISATSAKLHNPYGVAVDGAGNLYIADYGNNLIEKVIAPGASGAQIVAVAGGGGTVPTTTAISPTSAQLSGPLGVAVDEAGNLYIADTDDNLVEKVSAPATSGAQIAVVAGGGGTVPTTTASPATSTQLEGPDGVAVDGAGDLYIADIGDNLVEEVSATTGQIVVVAGGGGAAPTAAAILATGAILGGPASVAVDGAGNLYIAAGSYNLVEKDFTVLSNAALALSFPSTAVGEASTQQTVTFQNIGNQNLDVTALSPDSGNNFNLGGSTTSCATPSFTLASGAGCSLGIVFQPSLAGPISGSIDITDNNLNASGAVQPINLSGTGTADPPVAGAVTTTVAYDSTGNVIPLSLSGGAAASVAVATQAAHGTAVASGLSITYTPAPGYSGPDSFTYTATNSGGTSSPATVTITVSAAPVLDFSLTLGTGSTSTATVNPGGTASYSLNITPTNGMFPGTVSFSVTGLPTGATATFTPATLPAASTGATVGLSIVLPAATAAVRGGPDRGSKAIPLAFGLLLLPLAGAGRLRKTGRKFGGYACLWLLLVLGSGAVAGIMGCGGGNGSSSTQTPQSYNLTVTATSGSVQHTAALTLNVQ